MNYSNCQFTWLKQKETLLTLAESLLKDGEYYDCQLCAEGHHVNVHRVILSCNSQFFKNILEEHNSDLPVITLEGVSSFELEALVEFMYTGVTRIMPSYLKNFFQIAKSLQLAGLSHYDNAQIDKIINESPTMETEVQDNYDDYSKNVLKYLDQYEISVESEVKETISLQNNDESVFLDESSVPPEIINVNPSIYDKFHNQFEKEELEETECLEQDLMEKNDCDAVKSNELEENPAESVIMYSKLHNVFIKNKDKAFNENITTVYSVSNFEDIEPKKEDLDEIQEEVKITNEDDNFVYVKLDNEAFDKIKESQISGERQNSLKNDVRFYTKKCLKVINPTEKNFIITRPKIQSIVTENSKTNNEDKKIYMCLKCGNKYSHRRTLLHHVHWICEQPATYLCSLCPYRGKRKFQLKSHMKHAHLLKMS